jgi:hypothetical protein
VSRGGVPGYQGPQGATGSTANTGFRGPQGSQGNQGYVGRQGFQGYTGPQGGRGTQGTAANTGYTGPQGYQGYTGVNGPSGPNGRRGQQGTQGPTGGGGTGPIGPTGAGEPNGGFERVWIHLSLSQINSGVDSVLNCALFSGGISGMTINSNNIVFPIGIYYIEYGVQFRCTSPLTGGSNTGTTNETVMIHLNDSSTNGNAEVATFETVSNAANSNLIYSGLTATSTVSFTSQQTRYPKVFNQTGYPIALNNAINTGNSCLMISKLA